MSHHHHHHHDHHDRLRHGLRRRLRRAGDDVAALEELQRDLEQATADVAARVESLRNPSAEGAESGKPV
jgi:hypothetical protein